MNKLEAIKLLGGTPKIAALAMGYTSQAAIYMWPDELTPAVADRVRGVLARRKASRKAAKEAKGLAL